MVLTRKGAFLCVFCQIEEWQDSENKMGQTLVNFSRRIWQMRRHCCSWCFSCANYCFFTFPRSGELRTQKLKSHLVRTQSLNVLPFKPGVGQYIAVYATLTARDFFLAYFYTSGPFTCIFSKTSPNFFLCWPAE